MLFEVVEVAQESRDVFRIKKGNKAVVDDAAVLCDGNVFIKGNVIEAAHRVKAVNGLLNGVFDDVLVLPHFDDLFFEEILAATPCIFFNFLYLKYGFPQFAEGGDFRKILLSYGYFGGENDVLTKFFNGEI